MSLLRVPFTAAQNEYLIAHYATASKAEVLAMFPGRSWANIMKRGSRIGSTTNTARRAYAPKLWTAPADAYLRAHYPTAGARAVADHLGLTHQQAGARARYLGVSRLKSAKAPVEAPAPVPRKPYAARAPRVAAPSYAPLLAVKRSALTPVLNVVKEARKRREQPRSGLAEAIARHKTLAYGCKEHTAFLRDGLAGWQQWKAQQAA